MTLETYSLRAGARRIDAPYGGGEAVRVASREWPGAEQSPQIAEGRYGGVRISSDLASSVTTSLTISADVGHVPGDPNGRAINRVTGRAVQTATTGGSQALVSWTADTSDRNPQAADLACLVRISAAGTVRLAALRSSTVVASVDVELPAGAWRAVQLPGAAIAGSSALSLRVSLVGSAGGTVLEARRPVLGEGLDCTYHDEFTPGATSELSGRSVRPANGAAWIEAFTAGVQETIGAVRGASAPQLVVDADGADPIAWAVHSARADGEETPQLEGWEASKLQIAHAPLGDGAPRTLPGSLSVAGGVAVWTADEPVAGDDDALAEVTMQWSTSRRAATVLASPDPVLAFAATSADRVTALSANTTERDASIDGALNDAVLQTALYPFAPGMLDFAQLLLSPGRWHILVRAAAERQVWEGVRSVVPLVLRVGGVEAARVDVPTYAATPTWVPLRFGTVDVSAGETITLAADPVGDQFINLLIDQVVVVAAEGLLGASIDVGSPRPLTVVAGDAAGVSLWSGNLSSGEAGGLGSTWTVTPNTAGYWSRVNYQSPIVSGAGAPGRRASIGSRANGAALTAIVRWAADDVFLVLSYADSAERWKLETEAGQLKLTHPGAYEIPFLDLFPIDPAAFYEVTLAVDEEGRWALSIGREGEFQTTVSTGHAPDTAGGYPLTAELIANTGTIHCRAIALRSITEAGSLTWSTDSAGASGDLPYLPTGAKPRIVALGGASDASDAPPEPLPTDVDVVITPRYLIGPRS